MPRHARPKDSADSPAAQRLVQAAGRGFRAQGYGGAGVDALAREAGLTSGAFYAQFGSKAEAFRLAVAAGVGAVRDGVRRFQDSEGDEWLSAFVGFYFGERLDAPLPEACALPTLTADAMRSDEATRAAYTQALQETVEAIADGLPGPRVSAVAQAWQLVSILTGTASLALAVPPGPVRQAIVQAGRDLAARVQDQAAIRPATPPPG